MARYSNIEPVKAHVRSAAYEIGERFDVGTIYGFGYRPNKTEHDDGLALDFMVFADKAKGDAIAAYAVANAQRLGVWYIIWYRRIWRSSTGVWGPYSGLNPHVDHPHISFYERAGDSNAPPVPGSQIDVPGPWNADKPEWLTGAEQVASWVTNPHNWLRVAMVTAGALFLLVAIVQWDKVQSTVKGAVKNV